MLYLVKERREGLKYNIWGGGGRGGQEKGIDVSTIQKGVIVKKALNTFVAHCGLNLLKGHGNNTNDLQWLMCVLFPYLFNRQALDLQQQMAGSVKKSNNEPIVI